jgi:CRISPR system Cascade subunit CasD
LKNKYMVLWLEAPLQAWGASSRLWYRDTLDFPTKSGIIGMLMCGMGRSGEQKEFLASLSSLDHTIFSFLNTNNIGDRTFISKKEVNLRDFHMIGSGYDKKDPWEYLNMLKNFEGKKADGGSKITYRYYLQDAFFAAIIEIPESLEAEITEGLTAPVWELFLGRKCCIPSDIIFRGCFDTKDEAASKAMEIANDKSLGLKFTVKDGAHDGDEIFTINDIPVTFGEKKTYRDRQVTIVNAPMNNQ